ncbi:MAG: Nif3-like dinuclear metal center hexameric protein [Candidatus Helarchaeota archaeon]
MINLTTFIDKLRKIYQLMELKPESIIMLGPTKISELNKFQINKCIISTDFNYDAISALLEEKADILMLFYSWESNKITDELYKKLRYLRDKKICIIKIPDEFFSTSYGVHERIGSILGLEMVNLFNLEAYNSARIFESRQSNMSFNQLLDIIQTKFNLKFINYTSSQNLFDKPIKRILIYTERPPNSNLIVECYRQEIDTIICSLLDFLTARTAEEYKINVCDISFNWLNIVLEQFVTHDLQMEIPEIKSIFVPSNHPLRIFNIE